MDCWPAENCGQDSFVCVYLCTHSGSNLVVGTPVADDVYITFLGDVVDIPSDLICMGFDDYFIRCFRIDDRHGCAVSICKPIVYIWF